VHAGGVHQYLTQGYESVRELSSEKILENSGDQGRSGMRPYPGGVARWGAASSRGFDAPWEHQVSRFTYRISGVSIVKNFQKICSTSARTTFKKSNRFAVNLNQQGNVYGDSNDVPWGHIGIGKRNAPPGAPEILASVTPKLQPQAPVGFKIGLETHPANLG
jgi:hypothetical protein